MLFGTILGFSAFIINYIASSHIYSHWPSSVGGSIGLAFMPFEAIWFSIIPFLLGIALGYCLIWLKNIKFDLKAISSAVFILICLFHYCPKTYDFINTFREVRHIQTMSITELEKVVHKYEFKPSTSRKFILAAVVQNPNTTSKLLDQIARIDGNDLSLDMWSKWGLMGNNITGNSVHHLIAIDKRASKDTLFYLADRNDMVLDVIASNPNTPSDILRHIAKKDGYFLKKRLIENPNTPKDVVDSLKQSLEE